MSLILILNQPQVSQGLTTYTFTVPADGIYNIKCRAQVNESVATGFGAGSGLGVGADNGNGVTGGSPGASQVLQTVSNGQTGLGQSFPNVPANSAPGVDPTLMPESTPNLPSIALGSGVTGLGSGAGATSDDAAQSPLSVAGSASALVILVKNNGATVFTAPTFGSSQSAMQFKYSQPFSANDVMTVVLSSANASDKLLNSTQLTVSIGQGQ